MPFNKPAETPAASPSPIENLLPPPSAAGGPRGRQPIAFPLTSDFVRVLFDKDLPPGRPLEEPGPPLDLPGGPLEEPSHLPTGARDLSGACREHGQKEKGKVR